MRNFIISSIVGLSALGLIGFSPDPVSAHECHHDCGSYTTQELRDSGNYLGPATSNAHSGNVYEY